MKAFDWEYNILCGLIMRKEGKNTLIKVGISSGFRVSNLFIAVRYCDIYMK